MDELDFIGSYEQERSECELAPTDELPALAPLYELDAKPDPADAEVLQSLMAVRPQSALEFLGWRHSHNQSPRSGEAGSTTCHFDH